MTEPKPKMSVLLVRHSISHSSLRQYTGDIMMSGSQYKQSCIDSDAPADQANSQKVNKSPIRKHQNT